MAKKSKAEKGDKAQASVSFNLRGLLEGIGKLAKTAGGLAGFRAGKPREQVTNQPLNDHKKENAMAKKSEADKGDEAKASVGFGLGGLFEGIQKLVETAASLKESGEISQTGEFEIPGLGKDGKGIFGFSVRTLAGGEGPGVEVRPFGNIHKTNQGVAVEEAREAVVDQFEEDDHIRVIAELPGVSENAIKYEIKGDVLTIWTEGDPRYDTEVLLSNPVESKDVASTYNNGIFELRFKKTE